MVAWQNSHGFLGPVGTRPGTCTAVENYFSSINTSINFTYGRSLHSLNRKGICPAMAPCTDSSVQVQVFRWSLPLIRWCTCLRWGFMSVQRPKPLASLLNLNHSFSFSLLWFEFCLTFLSLRRGEWVSEWVSESVVQEIINENKSI